MNQKLVASPEELVIVVEDFSKGRNVANWQNLAQEIFNVITALRDPKAALADLQAIMEKTAQAMEKKEKAMQTATKPDLDKLRLMPSVKKSRGKEPPCQVCNEKIAVGQQYRADSYYKVFAHEVCLPADFTTKKQKERHLKAVSKNKSDPKPKVKVKIKSTYRTGLSLTQAMDILSKAFKNSTFTPADAANALGTSRNSTYLKLASLLREKLLTRTLVGMKTFYQVKQKPAVVKQQKPVEQKTVETAVPVQAPNGQSLYELGFRHAMELRDLLKGDR